ncbi:trna methyltransferase [Trichoderma cornu-damae]|uniref:Trna methyltransferase n=1 Tax=Trichoderma cornu-damae TaxID=654480 RepID=A0A9P8QQ49_9HYPO|nr:trna methyltransferase [Trichoderma cornu-damae]
MKIPYNKVHVQGQILFAARGGAIHTFRLSDGSHISSWKHPDVDKVADSIEAINETKSEAAPAVEADAPATESDGPPAKRQKLDGDTASPSVSLEAETSTPTTTQGDKPRSSGHFDGRGKKGKSKAGKDGDNGKARFARVPDRPVITHLTSTPNGSHLLAITGHDKAVWVFEHDGNGQLKELSRRHEFPSYRRPSAVVVGPDSQMICADKFGDVYALPLLIPSDGSTSSASLSSLQPPTKKPFKPTANTLTVHSKGNRLALLNQIKQAELASESKDAGSSGGPGFELNLLLGHVSMLTALVLGEQQGRRYILSADRDEHIRVSRYIPHAHIIENFCFGHKEFINDMVISPTRQGILVSGGGDECVFVWDWLAGKQLFKASVLSLAQELAPEATAVAVSGLYTLLYPSDDGLLTYILAICEDIKAVFSWKLNQDNELCCPGIIRLPGKPLSLAISPNSDAAPTVIAAIDPGAETKAQSLHAFRPAMNNGRLAAGVETSFNDAAVEARESDVSEDEIRSLLYTVESLRKVATGAQDEEASSEVPQGNVDSDVAVDAGDGEE